MDIHIFNIINGYKFYLFFDKLRGSRYQGKDKLIHPHPNPHPHPHPHPHPPPIVHIIIKKKKNKTITRGTRLYSIEMIVIQ
jgi:hypothetical protein